MKNWPLNNQINKKNKQRSVKKSKYLNSIYNTKYEKYLF